MVENIYQFSADPTYYDNLAARSSLDFPGGCNMFETEYSDWDIWHNHLDAHSNQEQGMKFIDRTMEDIRELGTHRMDHSYDSGNGKTEQYYNLNDVNLAAAPREQTPAAAISNYDEVFDGMMRDREAFPGQYEAPEITELAHVASAAETIGTGVNHIIARQALDLISTTSTSPGLSYSRKTAQNPVSSELRDVGAGICHFSDLHPTLIGSRRMQEWQIPTETASTISGIDTQSEAVLSNSSRTEQETSITSPERSRRRTNSSQSARPELNTRAGSWRRNDCEQKSMLQESSHSSVKLRCHCGKEFDIPSALKKHQKYHLQKGGRPHRCEHCPKDFADLRDLRRHLSKVHPELPMEAPLEAWKRVDCESCHKSYSRRDILLRHIAQEAQTCGEHYKQKSESATRNSSTLLAGTTPDERRAAPDRQ